MFFVRLRCFCVALRFDVVRSDVLHSLASSVALCWVTLHCVFRSVVFRSVALCVALRAGLRYVFRSVAVVLCYVVSCCVIVTLILSRLSHSPI